MRLRIAQVFANKTSDGAQTAKEKESKFEAGYVGEVVRRGDEIGELTKQLR